MARASMSFALKTRKYNVIDAVNGKDALQKLQENPDIGLVITDINMPVMNGIELISTIRGKLGNKTLPIFALTTEESAGADIMANGATGFLLKNTKTSEEIQKIVIKYIG
jgi:two-component system chemotaxis response regulator CheY